MGSSVQEKIIQLWENNNPENLVVILGDSEAGTAGLNALTVTAGDPTEKSPLYGVSLGLNVYHIFELKKEIEVKVYNEKCGIGEMLLDVNAIKGEVQAVREEQFSAAEFHKERSHNING